MLYNIEGYAVPVSANFAASTSRNLEWIVLIYLWLLDFGYILNIALRELLADLLAADADRDMPVVEYYQPYT